MRTEKKQEDVKRARVTVMERKDKWESQLDAASESGKKDDRV